MHEEIVNWLGSFMRRKPRDVVFTAFYTYDSYDMNMFRATDFSQGFVAWQVLTCNKKMSIQIILESKSFRTKRDHVNIRWICGTITVFCTCNRFHVISLVETLENTNAQHIDSWPKPMLQWWKRRVAGRPLCLEFRTLVVPSNQSGTTEPKVITSGGLHGRHTDTDRLESEWILSHKSWKVSCVKARLRLQHTRARVEIMLTYVARFCVYAMLAQFHGLL